MLAERYGRYYFIGRKFVGAIGHPSMMRAFTEYGVPQEGLMKFVLRLMGNLTDGKNGDAQDKSSTRSSDWRRCRERRSHGRA